MPLTKKLNKNELLELYNSFVEYYTKIKTISKTNNIKIRLPNFNGDLSENIIRLYINNYENRNCECSKNGDLCINEIKIEVKCFSSSGPSSFGPKESWNEIYFLDATNFYDNRFKIFKCSLSNNSTLWKNIKINKSQSYYDVCKSGKRPRIVFSLLKSQLKNNIKEIYNGCLENIIDKRN